MADLYSVLGVERDADQDHIKRAYRKLARKLHPDVNSDPETQDHFKEITAAYEVLSDPGKRRNYDMGGDGGFGNFGNAGFGFGDIMDAFFGAGAGNRGPRPRMRAGQDALIRIEVDLDEACFGTEREISVESAVRCTKCDGTGCADGSKPRICDICRGRGETQQVTRSFIGQVMTSRPCVNCQGYGSVIPDPCPECAGDGRVRARQTIPVKIPAGVETGNRIQLSGRGEVGPGGGPAGDLYVEIVQTPHEFLLRDGDTLHIALGITMAAAALGTTLSVETLDGPIPVMIKAGTQSGATIPVKGKGVTHLRGGGRGDLIVHLEVHTPTKLNKEQEELLAKFAQLRGEKDGEAQMQRHDGGFFSKFRDAFGR
ncbi:MAG: molecular chaperone DnaJ [Actinomycetota bacterium]